MALSLGYPTHYAKKFEDCYVDILQLIEMHYEIAKKTQQLDKENSVYWKGEKIDLSDKSFDGFITFMDYVNGTSDTIIKTNTMKARFNEIIGWFHKQYMDCIFEAPIPPIVADHEIDLLELYKMVIDMGGSDEVTRKEQWGDVAMNYGLPENMKNKFRGIYERYLDLPNA